MRDHSPDPARTRHVVLRVPRTGPHPSDPWVDGTYALIDQFERERHAAAAGHIIEVPSIIAASDYLWVRFGLRASWERLDVEELFALFASFAISPRWRRDCTATLEAFYAFLVQTRTVDADAGARIQAQLHAHRAAAEAELTEHGEPTRGVNRRERRAAAAQTRAARGR